MQTGLLQAEQRWNIAGHHAVEWDGSRGGQRHLSTENALCCRIFTEGLLGFRTTGFRSFELTPQMPEKWNCYSFRKVYACTDALMDIEVKRLKTGKLQVTITKAGKTVHKTIVKPGRTTQVHL